MKRLHVHVAVEKLAASIQFYSGLFGVPPTTLKPDYAKWQLDDPRMNFAISQRGAAPGLDHLGIQLDSDHELAQMRQRLDALQPGIEPEAGSACCYARSDKYWLTDPSGIAWETFHTLDTIPTFGESDRQPGGAASPAPPAAGCAPSGAGKHTRCC